MMFTLGGSEIDIAFYLPFKRDGISNIPSNIDDYWSWICANSGKGEGKYSWTLQTFLHLKQGGTSCSLVTELPKKGVIITHRDFLPVHQLPFPDLFVVCIKPDRKEHPWAQHYIVQNHNDPILQKVDAVRVSETLFWPQPSLIPRNQNRGTCVENIAYLGRLMNLEPELQTAAWKDTMHDLGFNWKFIPMHMWNDYSNIDVTVSIRGWSDSRSKLDAVTDWNSKPPTKLTNSWLANVPAIVGDEPAFQAVRGIGTDCLVARSADELKSALIELRDNHTYYQNLQQRGIARAKEFSADAITKKWQDIISGDVLHAYEDWMKLSKFKRQAINIFRLIRYFTNSKNVIDPMRGIIRSLNK